MKRIIYKPIDKCDYLNCPHCNVLFTYSDSDVTVTKNTGHYLYPGVDLEGFPAYKYRYYDIEKSIVSCPNCNTEITIKNKKINERSYE